MKNKLIIANWKMNGDISSNEQLLNKIVSFSDNTASTDIVICPPVIYFSQVKYLIEGSNIQLGAQNVCTELKGAFTGETSVAMLNEFACKYTLVGHSERRTLYKESEQEIAQKITQLVNAGQTPVFCIGETLEQRENNDTNTVIISQVQNIIDMVGLEVFKAVVIAYEPIWAIGTGKTASAEQAQEIHQLIRSYLNKLDAALFSNTAILYGGSVNENNANELIGQPDIDGFLVGGASLKAEAFEQICRSGQTASA
ncbi:triose-phosphate isomerase [Thalassotalea agariperforans]